MRACMRLQLAAVICLVIFGGLATTASAQGVLNDWNSVKMPPPPPLKPALVDAPTTALLLLDFTTQTCSVERRPRCAASVPMLKQLMQDARRHAMPVIYSVATADMSARDILPELTPAPGETVLPSLGPDKFVRSDLEKMLHDRGIQTLIVTGTAANTSVLHTASTAALHGFKVIVPVEGMSSNDAFPELYTVWHLANAARVMTQTTLTSVPQITYRDR